MSGVQGLGGAAPVGARGMCAAVGAAAVMIITSCFRIFTVRAYLESAMRHCFE